MLFTFIHFFLKKYKKHYLITFYIGIPIYMILYNYSLFQYYSSLIIPIDLFTLNYSISNNNNELNNITREFTKLASHYFNYINKKNNNDKMVKDYKQKKINIKDTLKHTLENLENIKKKKVYNNN